MLFSFLHGFGVKTGLLTRGCIFGFLPIWNFEERTQPASLPPLSSALAPSPCTDALLPCSVELVSQLGTLRRTRVFSSPPPLGGSLGKKCEMEARAGGKTREGGGGVEWVVERKVRLCLFLKIIFLPPPRCTFFPLR